MFDPRKLSAWLEHMLHQLQFLHGDPAVAEYVKFLNEAKKWVIERTDSENN